MILETKSMRILEAHNKMVKIWEKRNNLVEQRVPRTRGGTVLSRVDDYREQVEEKEALEKAMSAQQKYGERSWSVGLRDDQMGKNMSFLPVGHSTPGTTIYVRCIEDHAKPIQVIRRPLTAQLPRKLPNAKRFGGQTSFKLLKSKFESNPEMAKRTFVAPEPKDVEQLYVEGES